MKSTTFFFTLIPILASILLLVNIFLAPHNPYQEKNSPFECGYHSFLGQNRTQFNISFFIFALLFLLFDIDILFIAYLNNIYGLIIFFFFFFLLITGLAFELGKGALNISSKQNISKSLKQKVLLYSKASAGNNLFLLEPKNLNLSNNKLILNKNNKKDF